MASLRGASFPTPTSQWPWPPPVPHRLESLRGPGDSSWLLRGYLLLGAHPGASAREAREALRPLLAAGVSCFCCLQLELVSSLTAGAAQARSTYGASNVVTALPYFAEAQLLAAQAAAAPPAQVPVGGGGGGGGGAAPQAVEPGRLTFLHWPVPAAGPGTLPDADARRLCLELLAHMRAGELVYLHCSECVQ